MKYTITSNQLIGINDNNQKVVTISFTNNNNVLSINHVFVDEAFRSGGIAGMAMNTLYQHLQQNNLKAIPVCPYAINWFNKNPDKTDVLVR